MKKYYTDPLAAAYMAREFGVKLVSRHTDEQMEEYDVPESGRYFDWWNGAIVDGWSHDIEMIADAVKYIEAASDKIYLHPGSYNIFEPMVGDMCKCIETDVNGEDWDFVGPYATIDPDNFDSIIQRQGKPFFWPEE